MHVIAGKAVALQDRRQPSCSASASARTVAGARRVAEEMLGAGHGVNVLTGGTDVHLVLVDLRDSELDGQQAEDRLHDIGITVNRNAVPFDPRPPMVTSGLRIGAPALATRGLQLDDFTEVGRIIARALHAGRSSRAATSSPSACRRSPSATRCTNARRRRAGVGTAVARGQRETRTSTSRSTNVHSSVSRRRSTRSSNAAECWGAYSNHVRKSNSAPRSRPWCSRRATAGR